MACTFSYIFREVLTSKLHGDEQYEKKVDECPHRSHFKC